MTSNCYRIESSHLVSILIRDVGSISNLGGARHFEGTFFLKNKGASSKHEKGTSLFIEKSWGARVPSAPPGSYVSVRYNQFG